ncbi:MAG: hypothetical protein M3X11_11690 [Acidobacteriota bacterium]|nr:hypothetical protein [Acidobacteriota bacterium]
MSTSLPVFEEAKSPSPKPEKGKKAKKASTLNDLDLESQIPTAYSPEQFVEKSLL